MNSLSYIVDKLLDARLVEFAYQSLDGKGCAATGIISHSTQNNQVMLWLQCCKTLDSIAMDVIADYDDVKVDCQGVTQATAKSSVESSPEFILRALLRLFKAYHSAPKSFIDCKVCEECCMQKSFLERLLKIHRQSDCVSCHNKARFISSAPCMSSQDTMSSIYALLVEATVSFPSLMTWTDFESLNSRRRSLLTAQPRPVLSEDYLIYQQVVEQQHRVDEDASTSMESVDDTSTASFASIHFVSTSCARTVFHLRVGHHTLVFILPLMTGVLAAEEVVAMINEYFSFKHPPNVFAELLLAHALFHDIAATITHQAHVLFGSAAMQRGEKVVPFDSLGMFHLLEIIRDGQILACNTPSIALHTLSDNATFFAKETEMMIRKHVPSPWRYGSDCDMSKLLPLSSQTFQAPTITLLLPAQCSAGVNGTLPMVYLNIGPAECTWILLNHEQWSLLKTWLNYYKLMVKQVDDSNAEEEIGRIPIAWLKEAGVKYQTMKHPANTFLTLEPGAFFSIASEKGCSLIRWSCLPPEYRYCQAFIAQVIENELMHWINNLRVFLSVNLPERRQWDVKTKTTFNVAAKKAVMDVFQSPNELFQSLVRDEDLMMLCLELMLSAILVELHVCPVNHFQQLEKIIAYVVHLQAVHGANKSVVNKVKAMYELLHNAKLKRLTKKSTA